MMTKAEALDFVSKKLGAKSTDDDSHIVNDAWTLEKPFGWIFFYNSKKFLETGEFRYRLAGNGPVIVNKFDGSIQFLGSSPSELLLLEKYEESWIADHGAAS
jgi:hypothetical protein